MAYYQPNDLPKANTTDTQTRVQGQPKSAHFNKVGLFYGAHSNQCIKFTLHFNEVTLHHSGCYTY